MGKGGGDSSKTLEKKIKSIIMGSKGGPPLRVYMDVCCLNRPFDDQAQDKVRLETEAIVGILKRCGADTCWALVGSDIITLEASKNTDLAKRQKVLTDE